MGNTASMVFECTFSIVLAVHDGAAFLRDAVESVLEQDIGFQQHVQLIVVDDGSTDDSGAIADEYARRFPQNIRVIHQHHAGLPAARNEGLKYVVGRYVNFLASEDKLSSNALSEVSKFYDQHVGEVDVVSIPLYSVDGVKSKSAANDKYRKGTRVIDLEQEYDAAVRMDLRSCFIYWRKAMHMHFDTRMSFAEGEKECLKVLLGLRKLGIVAEAQYHDRGKSPGLQFGKNAKEWYTHYLRYFSYDCLQYAKQQCGEIPAFLQFAVMYDLQWRLRVDRQTLRTVLSEEELQEFSSLFYDLLQWLDDQAILKQKQIWAEQKCFLLSRKYHILPELHRKGEDIEVRMHGHPMIHLSRCKMCMEFMHIENDALSLEGYASFLGVSKDADIRIFIRVNGEKSIACSVHYDQTVDTPCLGEYILPCFRFSGTIENLSSYTEVHCKIYTELESVSIERKDFRPTIFFPVSKNFRESYALLAGWMVRIHDNELQLTRPGEEEIWSQEKKLIKELESRKDALAKEALQYRTSYYAMKKFFLKMSWGGDRCEDHILLFHIGIYKTGTSSLQHFFCQYPKEMLEEGWAYPLIFHEVPPLSKDKLLYMNRHMNGYGLAQAFQMHDAKYFERIMQCILKHLKSSHVIVSYESIWDLDLYQFFSRIMQYYANVKVIVYLRRQDEVIESLWKQLVKSVVRQSVSLSTYLTKNKEIHHSLNYKDKLLSMEQVFGNSLIVNLYELEAKKDIVSHFLRSIGVSPKAHSWKTTIEANLSLSNYTTEIRRIFNQVHWSPEFGDVFEYDGMFRRLDAVLKAKGKAVFGGILSKEERENILSRHKEENAWVAEHYFGRKDGRLFMDMDINVPVHYHHATSFEETMIQTFTALLYEQYKYLHTLNVRQDGLGPIKTLVQEHYQKLNELNKYLTNFEAIKFFAVDERMPEKLEQYFLSQGIHQVAVHGLSFTAHAFVKALGKTKITVERIIDRRLCGKRSHGLTVTKVQDLPADYALPIIVTAPFFFDQIAEEIKNSVDKPTIVNIENILNHIDCCIEENCRA